ncbi:MAG: VCBS repeat-containing protein [Kiritimatiellales bacterium]
MKQWGRLLAGVIVLCVENLFGFRVSLDLAVPPALVGGQPMPAGTGYGVISTEDGQATGTANVFGNGPYDLFVGLRNLYPFERFNQNNVPVYGARRTITSPNANGYVFENSTGDIFALVYSGEMIYLRKFNKTTLSFVAFSQSAAAGFSGGGNVTGYIGTNGKVHVYYTRANTETYEPNPNSHKVDYRPFTGAGFWTGGFGYDQLYYIRFSSTNLANREVHQRVGTGAEGYDYLFSCPGQTMASYGTGTLSNVLIGANKLGVFRRFQHNSAGLPNGVSFALDSAEEPVFLRHPVVNPNPASIRNPVNGLSDLIVSDSSRYWHYQLKRLENGSPVYGTRSPVLCASGNIICGALPVISPGDIDGDGRIDFIAGNDAGELLFIRNIGYAGAPAFANPVAISVNGRPFHERAGYSGSIQGPGEASWGYTCPTLFDWNGDGKLDIVMNTIRGNLMVLLQIDGAANPPQFSEAKPLFCDSLDLHLSWRTQPGVTTWGGTTVPCIIANDENNEFRCFYRIDNQNVMRGDVLKLNNGTAIRAHDQRYSGQWGRSKLVPVDWNRDGVIDLIVGTGRAQSIPGIGGIPDGSLTGDDRQSAVLFLRNTGSNSSPKFAWPARITYNGEPIRLGTHSCSPAAVDLDSGNFDLIVGEERGALIYYDRAGLGY